MLYYKEQGQVYQWGRHCTQLVGQELTAAEKDSNSLKRVFQVAHIYFHTINVSLQILLFSVLKI